MIRIKNNISISPPPSIIIITNIFFRRQRMGFDGHSPQITKTCMPHGLEFSNRLLIYTRYSFHLVQWKRGILPVSTIQNGLLRVLNIIVMVTRGGCFEHLDLLCPKIHDKVFASVLFYAVRVSCWVFGIRIAKSARSSWILWISIEVHCRLSQLFTWLLKVGPTRVWESKSMCYFKR